MIGGNGTIGKCVIKALKEFDENVEIKIAGRNSGDFKIDVSNTESIADFFKNHNSPKFDHIISLGG